MKIGVIGAGMIGGTLAKLWHTAEHEIGALAEGRRCEPGAPVYNTDMRASEIARELGVPA